MSEHPIPRRALVLLAVLTLVWGTNWPLFPLAVREISVWTFRAFAVILAGVALAIVAIFVAILRSVRGTGKVRGGGVVMIGPVPIVFGTDKESARILILLGIVLMIVLLLFSLLPVVWR